MAVQRVLKMGEPLLRQVASPVTSFDAELAALVSDMDDTMRALTGAGIAAPQIGVSARVVIFELKDNPRYPHLAPVPYTVLVNPVITPLGEEQEEGWEGCLSVPGMRGLVPHPGHRQAPFPTLLLLLAERRDHRVHEHGVRNRGEVRVARVVLELEDDHARAHPDLRSGDAGAGE